jgi:hypothetical protein
MIIKNAAGFAIEESGAPFMIIPTKTETNPATIPITVDFSKTSNLPCCRG